MKKFLLFVIFALLSATAFSTTVIIVNDGFAFAPADITIDLGDTVVFQLGEIHNAVEVDETTWNANGSAPLEGGFALPFGGGTVTGLSAGTHFYVCTPHASGGMKGKITVNSSSGIPAEEAFANYFSLYPNPAKNSIILESKISNQVNVSSQDHLSVLEIFNSLGEQVYRSENYNMLKTQKLDLAGLPSGIYILRAQNGGRNFSRTFIKE